MALIRCHRHCLLQHLSSFCLQGLLKIFSLIGIALFAYADYRALSKNIPARRAENARYQEMVRNIKEKIHPTGADKTHRVYICPNKSCGQKIRVPKGKGKIEITCPKCGQKFVKRT